MRRGKALRTVSRLAYRLLDFNIAQRTFKLAQDHLRYVARLPIYVHCCIHENSSLMRIRTYLWSFERMSTWSRHLQQHELTGIRVFLIIQSEVAMLLRTHVNAHTRRSHA